MSSQPLWRIDRLELVYFNPKHNRWQLFQESGDAAGKQISSQVGDEHNEFQEARHRRHLQALLHDCGQAVKRTIGQHPSLPVAFSVARKTKRAINFSSTLKVGTEAVEKLRVIPSAQETWHNFLDYLLACTRSHGLSPQSRNELSVFLTSDAVQSLVGSTESKKIDAVTLSRRAALDLISILPVLSHWDLWGLLGPEWSRTAGNSELRLVRNFRPVARRSPFYAARVEFGSPSTKGSAKSIELLGYNVRVELTAGDLSKDERPSHLPEGDFFDYCHKPCSDNSPGHENERALYLGYAFFVDAINAQLAGESQSGTGNLYLICYPIEVMGWIHYLQVHLAPPVGIRQQSNSLDLWQAWAAIHRVLHWGEVREHLASQLEFVNLVSFQYEVVQALRNPQSRGRLPSLRAEELLCEHGYQVFPVKEIKMAGANASQTVWRYEDYFWGDPRICVGKEWKSAVNERAATDGHGTSRKPLAEVRLESVIAQLRPPLDASPAVQLLHRSCARLIFQEHRELCEKFIERELKIADEIRSDKQNQIRHKILALGPSEKAMLRSQIMTSRGNPTKVDTLSIGDKGFEMNELVDLWTELGMTPDLGRDALINLALTLTAPRIPQILSEYLEVGAVKRVTHDDDGYFKPDSSGLLSDLDARFKRMCEEISPMQAASSKGVNQIREFHARVVNHLKQVHETNQLYNASLESELNKLRCRLGDWVTELEKLGFVTEIALGEPNPRLHGMVKEEFSTPFQQLYQELRQEAANNKVLVRPFSAKWFDLSMQAPAWRYAPALYRCCLIFSYSLRCPQKLDLQSSRPDWTTNFNKSSFNAYGTMYLIQKREDQFSAWDLCSDVESVRKVEMSEIFPKSSQSSTQGQAIILQGASNYDCCLVIGFDCWDQHATGGA